jgi:hypothetical protein
MPVRRRIDRRRAGEVEAWANFLYCGCDFFDELPAVGLTEATAGPLAEETWHRLGPDVIAHLDKIHEGFHPYPRPIWAEEQFGPAKGARRRAGRYC